MRRSHVLLVCGLGVVGLARCQCEETLREEPTPDIQVLDPVTGRSNDDPKQEDDGNAHLRVEFGAAEVGQNQERKIQIKNVGASPLRLTSIKFAPADASDAICPRPSGAIRFKSAAEQAEEEELKTGVTKDVTVVFEAVGGSHCRALQIKSNDPDEETVHVYFTASGTGPALCAVPDNAGEMNFGVTRVGSHKQMTQRVESCGNQPVRLTGISIDQGTSTAFTLDIPTAAPAGELPPCDGSNAATCGFDVQVTFAPTARGAVLGWLNITTQTAMGEVPYPFKLVGEGAECSLSVTPTAVVFGSVASQASSLQTVVVRNVGECHCVLDAITTIEPLDTGFAFESPSPPATPLALRGSVGCEGDAAVAEDVPNTVTLLLKYTSPARQNSEVDHASFHIHSAANIEAPDITVNMEATGGGSARCEVKVDPELPNTSAIPNLLGLTEDKTTYKRFGRINFGRATKQVTKRMPINLTNIGNSNCDITGLAWDTAVTPQHHFGLEDAGRNPIAVGGNPGLTIPPGNTLVLYATYTPADEGEKWVGAKDLDMLRRLTVCGGAPLPNQCDGNGVRITIPAAQNIDTTSFGGGPGIVSIGFDAQSVAPAIDVIPTEMDFGLVTMGCGSEEREIKIYNTGTGDLTVSNARIDPVLNPPEFKITSSPVPPDAVVTPGSSIRIKIRFYPRHAGPHTANMVITTKEGEDIAGEFTVPLKGEGTSESHVVDIMQQLREPQVDVLWVVDDSGSMLDDQSQVAHNFPYFFNQTTINSVDFHIAVTTTLYGEQVCTGTHCSVQPHPMAGVRTACDGNDPFLTRASQNPEDQFACNIKVSNERNPARPRSDAAEAGLYAAKAFLSQPNITDPNINGGFLRQDAKLYVIALTDEEDQSPGPTDLYVDFFQNLKGYRNRSLVSFSAIAAGPDTTDCGEGASSGDRYKDVVDALGTGLFEDLCDQNWGPTLQALAFDSFGLKTQFFLTRGADPSRITVCVADTEADARNGTHCGAVPQAPENPASNATGFFYEAASNSIVFNHGSVPLRGQWIRVEYDTMCLPVN